MIKLYPHTLTCIKPGESTVIDGIPTSGPGEAITAPCRYRPNTSARSVKGADGQTVVYRGTCYVPTGGSGEISTGDTVSVDGQVDSATVLQVYKAQMRTRIILM